MKLSDYTYDLPESAIADRPPTVRGSSRLLALNRHDGSIMDSYYKDIATFIQPGDVVIMNNTKVIPARLHVRTAAGAQRELLLLERHGETSDHHRLNVMYRRHLTVGQLLTVGDATITVEKVHGDGTAEISSQDDIWHLAEVHGTVPLPPYMHRDADESDRERYQTVFAKETGSVAAPTASLNLTPHILDTIRQTGATLHELTLHVGLGTFMPIRVEDVTHHEMHQEYFEIPADTITAIRAAKKAGKRVIAIGTTVTRTLEFAADQIAASDAPQTLRGEANIFIYPGYTFKTVDAMVTNFHAPKSTVLMMAAAFAGWDTLKNAYQHALDHSYTFLSYGDSMLLY